MGNSKRHHSPTHDGVVVKLDDMRCRPNAVSLPPQKAPRWVDSPEVPPLEEAPKVPPPPPQKALHTGGPGGPIRRESRGADYEP